MFALKILLEIALVLLLLYGIYNEEELVAWEDSWREYIRWYILDKVKGESSKWQSRKRF